MSRSRKNKKSPGAEFWKPRKPPMATPGRIAKEIAKATERAAERRLEHDALTLEDADVAATDGPKRSPCKPRG